MHIRNYLIFIIGLLLLSCDSESKTEKEIANIDINFKVERFDQEFLNAKPKDLPKLKEEYPFLFSKHIPDSIVVNRMNDSLQQVLLREVQVVFPDFETSKNEVNNLFQHLKYYDKTFRAPRVITLTNDVAYREKVIVTDSIVLVALDNYLGSNHEFYQNIPLYIASNMKKEQLVVDVAEGYAQNYMFQTNRKTLRDEMIYHGKLLYFKDVMIPFKSAAERIGYSEEQLKWAELNESQIWSYFIEKELLYDTDPKLSNRFIANAPFSKFYLELDNESPGRLGQYIGWQIVKAYAKNTGEEIVKVMQTEPEIIFRKSKFKPKK